MLQQRLVPAKWLLPTLPEFRHPFWKPKTEQLLLQWLPPPPAAIVQPIAGFSMHAGLQLYFDHLPVIADVNDPSVLLLLLCDAII